MIEEIKEKSGAVGDTKSEFQKCFEDWKNADISVLYLRVVTLKGIEKILNNGNFLITPRIHIYPKEEWPFISKHDCIVSTIGQQLCVVNK